MFYDLLIPFILLYHRTKGLVIFFHIFKQNIMIISSLIFFSKTHKKILEIVTKPFKKIIHSVREIDTVNIRKICYYDSNSIFYNTNTFSISYALYPGELFWNEQGYRFSWRVMGRYSKLLTKKTKHHFM